MFTPHIMEGAKLTSATSGKYGLQSQHEALLQNEEPFHLNTDMVNLNVNQGHKKIEKVIIEKYAEIEYLKDNLSKGNFMIWFLEKQNQQLKVKEPLFEKYEVDVGKEDIKGKLVIYA